MVVRTSVAAALRSTARLPVLEFRQPQKAAIEVRQEHSFEGH